MSKVTGVGMRDQALRKPRHRAAHPPHRCYGFDFAIDDHTHVSDRPGAEPEGVQKMDEQTESGGTNGRSGFVNALLAAVLLSAAFYFARVVLEPIAFAFFGIALVWPVLKALQARMPNALALLLTILLTLVGFVMLVLAIVWSIGDIVHWILENLVRFKSLYARVTESLEAHGIFVAEWAGQYDVRTFAGLLQKLALDVNYFVGFCCIIFLLLTFGLTEMAYYEKRFDELEPKLGLKISQTANVIGIKLRRYMLIRTIASIATGFAVFLYSLSVGLDLAIAWGVVSLLLNYIPYIGPVVAVIFPVVFATVQFASWQMPAIVFGGLFIIQTLIGNYLEPIIAGKALSVSPFAMLVAFFFWGFLWGIPGAFIGLPMTIALITICEQSSSGRWIVRLLSPSYDMSLEDT
jgi:AI-2 transport protein TqsA